MVNLDKGEIVIAKGSGFERYVGVRTAGAIRTKVSRERKAFEKVEVWYKAARQALPGYYLLDKSLDATENYKVIAEKKIETKAAAVLAASKRK